MWDARQGSGTNTVISPGQERQASMTRKAADGSQSTSLARIRGVGRGTLDEVVGQNGGRWLQCLSLIGQEMRPLGTLHQAPLTIMRRHTVRRTGMDGQSRQQAGKHAAQTWR
jgi:hypothetical protein